MQETIERYRNQVKDVQTDTSSVEDVEVHILINNINSQTDPSIIVHESLP